MDERGPIFIGGLSQSGKTELRLALGAHPSIELTRHTDMWDRFYGRYGNLGRPRNLDRCLAAMTHDRGVGALDPDPERIRREFRDGPPSYARLFGLIHRHHAERAGKRRWGEQLGFIERFADPIFETFPSARMVHLIRDPRTRWRLDRGSRRRPGSLGWETARWLRSAELADRNRRRYGDRYLAVRYEALAADPISTINHVCAFVEEDCTPTVLDAMASLRFDPPDGTSAYGSSLRERSTEDAFVERQAREALSAFGYAAGSTTSPSGDRSPHRPVDRAAMTAWRLLDGLGPVGARG